MKTKIIVAVAIGMMATGIIASLIISRPWIAFRNVEPLKVTGYAEIPVSADIASMEVTLTETGPSRQFAYEECGTQLNQVRELLKEEDDESYSIKELASGISEVLQVNDQGKRMNQIDYYVARRTLKIESSNVALVEQLQRSVYDLNASEMNVSVSGPRYLISDLGETKIELVEAATKNGMKRAKTIAKNAKAKLGNLVSAKQGVIQITQPNSTDTSDWGTYDTSTIEKVAKITVHLELEIK